jgi:LCP family protein required for cell wall assembly
MKILLNKVTSHTVGLRKLAIGGLIISVILGAGVLSGAIFFYVSKQFTLRGINVVFATSPEFQSTTRIDPVAPQSSTTSVYRPAAPITEPALAEWDGAGRVTVLLLGLDYRDWESGSDYSRSDTMILLSLDPLSKSAAILTIPRDMWVSIPGFKHGKINTAYYLGEAYKLPGGGPGLATKTVEQFLGIPINYYAQIDFDAFVKFINELGGVKINVPERITVDLLGAGSATKKALQPGVQVLPGEWALAYARARYTEGGDFDRAARQQQVILAIRDRILSFDMLPLLIQKADVLYTQLSSGIHTNLSLQEVIQLAILASQVEEGNIKRGIISKEHVLFGESPDKLAILIPIPDKIHTLRDSLFVSSGVLGPQTLGTAQEKMVLESARVAILNGSGTVGLEYSTADHLRTLGVNIYSVGSADNAIATTILINHTSRPFTAAYLVELLKISPNRIQYEPDPSAEVDISLILGNDWARENTLP